MAVSVLQAAAVLETLHAVFKLVPGSPLASLLLHGGRDITLLGLCSCVELLLTRCLIAIWAFEPVQTDIGVFLTFFFWAIGEAFICFLLFFIVFTCSHAGEIARYPYYILVTMDSSLCGLPHFIKNLRYTGLHRCLWCD